MADPKPWAVYSDLSGVAEVSEGAFATEREAQDNLVWRLIDERRRVGALLGRARRRQTTLINREARRVANAKAKAR